MVKNLIKSMQADDEKKSWDVQESASYRLCVQINGMGLIREFPAMKEKDKFYQGTGRTEAEVMQMVAQAKRKGLQPTLYITESVSRRLV